MEEKEDSIQEDFKRESIHMNQLQQFNKILCDEGDRLMSVVSEFIDLTSSLSEVSDGISEILGTRIDTGPTEGTEKYSKLCGSLSAVMKKSLTEAVTDSYTTKEVTKLRNTFHELSELSRCYAMFHPKELIEQSSEIQEILDVRFSEALIEIAEKIRKSPEECENFNMIPIDFPHHEIAYGLLRSRLIDAQEHLTLSECSCWSQKDQFEAKTTFPSPKVLERWPDFQRGLEAQNQLIKEIAELRNELKTVNEEIRRDEEVLQEGHEDLRRISAECFALKNSTYSDLETRLQLDRELNKLSCIKEEEEKEFENTELEQLNSHYLKMLEEVDRDIQLCEKELYGCESCVINKQEFSEPELNLDVTEMKSNMETLLSVAESFGNRDIVYQHVVVSPAMENMDRIIDFFKQRIDEKRRKASDMTAEIQKRRKDCDNIAEMVKQLKERLETPERFCRLCDERRKYVITRCGHTFCERCFNEIKDMNCPKCNVGGVFKPEEVLELPPNWE